MCIAWLRSLFRKSFMLDGPGMERRIWSAFTISRCSIRYEPVYIYTVKYDEDVDEAYLCITVSEGQAADKSIRLEGETVSALLNLDLMSLPDAEILDGTFVGLSVTDPNGQVCSKSLSNAMEQEILALITPYIEN